MTDGEMRAVVLRKFYELRHEKDLVSLQEIVTIDPHEGTRIANICDQLGEQGLIEWRPIRSAAGTVHGLGRISPDGIDVIEGRKQASAQIIMTTHDHSISVSGSTNIQIGNANVQGVTAQLGKLMVAVDHSTASEAEKNEAKSLLEKVAASRLVQTVLASVLGSSAAV
jgi:hypothetical protein